ncbi:hypothetical protein BKA12_001154 [Neomicrococcus lactis]|uniref:Uncharacterized protein n=1 Tax=Neomicrococcus lactis TaxID=732241 RepID=A0A7W8YAQ9_9MICC|nr:hypothetical protein [Neomicrococcus lactis]
MSTEEPLNGGAEISDFRNTQRRAVESLKRLKSELLLHFFDDPRFGFYDVNHILNVSNWGSAICKSTVLQVGSVSLLSRL